MLCVVFLIWSFAKHFCSGFFCCFFQITKMQKNELKTNLYPINFGVELKTAVSLRSLTFWRNLAGRGFSNPNISESSVKLVLAQIYLSHQCNPRWRWDLRSLGGLIATSCSSWLHAGCIFCVGIPQQNHWTAANQITSCSKILLEGFAWYAFFFFFFNQNIHQCVKVCKVCKGLV